MNLQTALDNLTLLYLNPTLQGIRVAGGERLALGIPHLSQDLVGVINRTFRFAREYQNHNRILYAQVLTSDGGLHGYSAGYVLSHLHPPENIHLESVKLLNGRMRFKPIRFQCHGMSLIANLDALLVCNYFRAMFRSPFKEKVTLTVPIDCSPRICRDLINFFQYDTLPPLNETMTDLLLAARWILSEQLNRALIEQLIAADNLEDESWAILFRANPELVSTAMMCMSRPRRLTVLREITRPSLSNQEHRVAQVPERQSINRVARLFHFLRQRFARRGTLPSSPAVMNLEAIHFTEIDDCLVQLIRAYQIGMDDIASVIPAEVRKKLQFLSRIIQLMNDKEIQFSALGFYNSLFEFLLPVHFGQIKVLDLGNDTLIRQVHVWLLITKCSRLEELILSKRASGQLLKCLKHVPLLTRLELKDCGSLERRCLDSLRFVRRLEILNLDSLNRLVPCALTNLRFVRQLRSLNLSGVKRHQKVTPLRH